MKPKALMLSTAVLLGSAAVAFAQANSPPTITPSGPTSGAMTQPINQSPTTSATPGTNSTGSTAAQQTNTSTKAPSTETKSATTPMKTARKTTPRKANRREEMADRRANRDPATTALNLLEEHGYHDFSTFQRAGKDYEIKTNKNGSTVTVLVNPSTKTVQTQG